MARVTADFELTPKDGHKSFYGKAIVRTYSDGSSVLRSYGTDVMTKDADGTLHRHWMYWSSTTGRHVAAFAGINKAVWDKMPVEPIDYDHSFLKWARGLSD